MPASLVRKTIWGVTAVAAIVILIVAMLPLIASTRIVRDRIALEMSAWTGYRVELAETPEIQVWPTFKAVLNDVSLSDWEAERRPVLDAERVELELSATAALTGNVVISTARLVRPVLYVSEVAPNRYAPVVPKIGRMRHAIDRAREIVAENPTAPDLSALDTDSFGTLEFSDGQIIDVEGGRSTAIVTGLAGAIEWPDMDRRASISANGIWRGENFSVEASSTKPLLLLAGGSAPAVLNIKAAPGSGSFDGVASLSADAFFDGRVTFNSSSLRRMLEWSHSDLPPGASSGSIGLSGHISGDRKRLKLEDAQITLDGNPSSGVLELSFADAVPGIAGTLAFDQLDLRAFLTAFTPFTLGAGNVPSAIDIAFAEKYNLDLRLSAARATVGDLAFTDVAATAQVRGDLTAFDISDATIFGGTVQAGIRYDRKGDGGDLDVRLLASNIDAANAVALAKSVRVAPVGKATISLMAKGPGRDWSSFLDTASGSFSVTFGPGNINGFDIAAFIGRVQKGGFFALRDVATGSMAVDRAELRATLADGAATIERAEAQLGGRTVALSGVIPYVGGGLALSGAVVVADAATPDKETAEASFFVGGPWTMPFVSPIFAGTSLERPRLGQSN